MFYQRVLFLSMMLLLNSSSAILAAQLAEDVTGNEKKVEVMPNIEVPSITTESQTSVSIPTTRSTTNATPKISTTSSVDTTTTTSTTPAPPAPSPYPEPSIGQWNSSCIMVKMAAQLNITYETKDKNTSTTLYNIPVNARYYDGQCKSVTQTIQINWGDPSALGSMLLQFDLKDRTVQLTMIHFVIPIVGDRFPNAMENQTIFLLHMGKDFASPVGKSYHCTRPEFINLSETLTDPKVVGSITVHDVQVEAFRSSNNSNTFSAASDCESSAYPGIVPIAVGITLISMIIIILVAYLCARRNSTSSGYMSF